MTDRRRLLEEDRVNAIDWLKKRLPPGSTVYTVVTQVARSGLSRWIIPFIISQSDCEPWSISRAVASVLWLPLGEWGVRISGAGMDMGFELVYRLGWWLYRDGFECPGSGCPSNAHTNGDRDYSPHRHNEGGYALRQRWL